MFKKIIFAFLLIFVLLIATIAAVPYLFKDKLIAVAKTEMNNYLDADANFKDVDISIFKDFPNLSFSLIDFSVVNHEPFNGDTLASIDALNFSLDIMPILKSNLVAINSVSIVKPNFKIKVLEDGLANYDIVKESDAPAKEKKTEAKASSDIRISLQQYSIEDAQILYEDKPGDLFLNVKNLNHSGEGDFTLEQFNLSTKTSIDELSVNFDGIDYMKKSSLELDLSAFIDLAQSTYQIKENRLKVNELELKLNGLVKELPDDAYDLDLKFETPSTNFKSLLSLIPAVYMTDFQGLKADGSFNLNGDLKGVFKDESYPAFNLGLNVDNGTFQYPDLPAAVRQVFIDLDVSNTGGSLNNTVIDLQQFKMKLGEEPIDFKAVVKQPMTDPLFDLALIAKVNLANVKNYYPLEEKLSGQLDLNLTAKGKVSTIEAEKYEEFDAMGTVGIKNMVYETSDLPLPVNVNDLSLEFNPNKVEMKNLAVKIGKSDLRAAGGLENFFAYSLGAGKLNGKLTLASDLLDLNELMGLTEGSEETPESTESNNEETSDETTFELPDDIEFDLTATVAKIKFDKAELDNNRATLKLSERRLDIDNLSADVLGGKVNLGGYFLTPENKSPFLDFNYDISNLNVKEAYNTFNSVQSLAPIAKHLDGVFSSDFHLKTELDQQFNLVEESVNGQGKVDLRNATLSGFKGIDQIAEKLKLKDLKELKISRIMTVLEISDGRVHVEPFDFNVKDIKMNVSGSHGLDQSLDYSLLVNIPSNYLSGATDYVGSLINQANIPGLNSSALPSTLAFNIGMGGTMDNPKISVSLAGKETESSLKNQAKEEFQKKKEELEQKAREEADRLKREAEEKARQEAERLKKEAEKAKQDAERKAKEEADRLKKEAEQKAKEEAEKAKDKVKGLFGPK